MISDPWLNCQTDGKIVCNDQCVVMESGNNFYYPAGMRGKTLRGAGQEFKTKKKTRKEACVRYLLYPGRGLGSSIDVVVHHDLTKIMKMPTDLARPRRARSRPPRGRGSDSKN